jgi:hypothetical protein
MFQVHLAQRALVAAGQNPGRLPGDLLWLIGSLNLATTFAEEYARRQADGGRWVVAALLRVRDELAAAQARRRGPIESARGYFCAICRSDEAPGERALEEAGRLLREHEARMTAPEERAVGDRIGGGT